MRILIVDDSASLRNVLETLFKSLGHEVVGSLESGEGVEALVTHTKPHLVCLDYNLPGRNGLQILSSLNALAPEIDVVFMTASDQADLEQRAADAGASGFLRKPFNKPQILAELKDVAEAREMSNKTSAAESATGRRPAPAATEGATAAGDTASANATGGVRRRAAVIADDSGSVRMVLKGLLEEAGLKVVQAVASGSEAVQAVKSHRPGVVCLDVNMPGMSGIEALPLIREACPETAVVMVTACADREFVQQAAAHGAKGYILKPLRPAYVLEFMGKLLGP